MCFLRRRFQDLEIILAQDQNLSSGPVIEHPQILRSENNHSFRLSLLHSSITSTVTTSQFILHTSHVARPTEQSPVDRTGEAGFLSHRCHAPAWNDSAAPKWCCSETHRASHCSTSVSTRSNFPGSRDQKLSCFELQQMLADELPDVHLEFRQVLLDVRVK